ncbi:hypothetical protein Btru_076256 [Bulinus truncatus]|nr:hypothetical protein Btru_076256 [Bulinus truncatus]
MVGVPPPPPRLKYMVGVPPPLPRLKYMVGVPPPPPQTQVYGRCTTTPQTQVYGRCTTTTPRLKYMDFTICGITVPVGCPNTV